MFSYVFRRLFILRSFKGFRLPNQGVLIVLWVDFSVGHQWLDASLGPEHLGRESSAMFAGAWGCDDEARAHQFRE